MRRFGDGNAFASAGIKNAHRAITGHEGVEGSFKCSFVGRVIAVFGKIPSEPREHEGHKKSPVWRGYKNSDTCAKRASASKSVRPPHPVADRSLPRAAPVRRGARSGVCDRKSVV